MTGSPAARAAGKLLRPERMVDVHPDLGRVVYRAVTIAPFPIQALYGYRSYEQQQVIYSENPNGASPPGKSYHNAKPSLAVDLAGIGPDGKIDWGKPGLWFALNDAMVEAARIEQVEIKWGGTFKRVFDGPHFQLGDLHPAVVRWKAQV